MRYAFSLALRSLSNNEEHTLTPSHSHTYPRRDSHRSTNVLVTKQHFPSFRQLARPCASPQPEQCVHVSKLLLGSSRAPRELLTGHSRLLKSPSHGFSKASAHHAPSHAVFVDMSIDRSGFAMINLNCRLSAGLAHGALERLPMITGNARRKWTRYTKEKAKKEQKKSKTENRRGERNFHHNLCYRE